MDGGGGSTGHDAGSGAGHDSGAGASDSGGGGGQDATTAANAFTGAGPYQSQPVQVSAKAEHQNRGVGIDPTGQNCLGCHNGGGAVRFGVGGTIYTSQAGTTGAADVQLRFVKTDGSEYVSVHSDADGNFWVADNGGFGAVGGMAGARNATTTQLMPQQINSGACVTCHDGTTQPKLHLP